MPVGKLAAELPVTRSAVSQHLKILKDAGLVSEEAVGTKRLRRPCRPLLDRATRSTSRKLFRTDDWATGRAGQSAIGQWLGAN